MRSDLRGRPPDVSRILPNLLVGEYPRVADAGWLQSEHGVSAVLSLQHESDLWDKGVSLDELEREYRDRAIEFRHVPVQDTSESDLDAALPHAVAVLQDLIARGHTVFVHCNAGYNRSPTVAIAYLHTHEGLPLAVACEDVKAKRHCVPYMRVLQAQHGPRG